MEVLFAKIDKSIKKATFSGPGTFLAKDRIKSLGSARWNGVDKSWEVSGFELSDQQLEEIFPNVKIETINQAGEQLGVENVESISASSEGKIPSSYSVSQLSSQIRSVLKQAFPQVVYVHGVLSSVKRSADGRLFMELAEQERPDEIIRCVIWKDEQNLTAGLRKAGFNLENELQVMFAVEVDLNKKWAAVSLSVTGIVAEYTIAKLKAQREQTNEKLKAEGLFDKNRSLSLPFLPRKLGLITSSSGTVINDFIDSLNAANFGFELYWVSTAVQGQNAKQEIIKALKKLENEHQLDAILIFRGGGSAADLSVFNDYELVKAICLSKLPICSAIGHQEDQSSLQDVSFKSFGVPKDLGHYFAGIVIEYRRRYSISCDAIANFSTRLFVQAEKDFVSLSKSVFAFSTGILQAVSQNLQRFSREFPNSVISFVDREEKLLSRSALPTIHLAHQMCEFNLQRVGELFKLASNFFLRIVQENEKEITAFERFFDSISPKQQLLRGFAIVRRSQDKSVVTRAGAIEVGSNLEIEFADSNIEVLVNRKVLNE